MNRSGRFFRTLWRINAVVILLAFAALLVLVASLVIPDLMRTREAPVAAPAVAAPKNVRLEFGQTYDLKPPFARIQLVERGERSSKAYSSRGDSESVRNFLVIDGMTGATHWVLPDNDHVIAQNEWPHLPEKEPLAGVLLVEPAASTSKEERRLLLTDPAMQRIVEIARGVDHVENISVIGKALSILCLHDGKLRLITADPPTLVKTTDLELGLPRLH